MGAFHNALWEEGTKKEIFEWMLRFEKEVELLRRLLEKKGVKTQEIDDYVNALRGPY